MKFGGKFLKAIAIALMFWCAGTGCLMVSYARGMSDGDSNAPAEEQSMDGMHASMDAHACCKAKHKNAKRAKTVKSSRDLHHTQFGLPSPVGRAMSCCPLTTGSIVIASRSQSSDSASASDANDSSSFKLTSLETRPLAVPLRLPNRAQAYLLDCAFLI